ncbi:transketolase C-terminal domain-containing protein [Nocardia sp. CA-084685]|uniref:transketolase C-terminal domain-containing protein n=1 Tax=Nocardia sp. CA-084685 TaxID=3239970 RepID=UPI003D991D38
MLIFEPSSLYNAESEPPANAGATDIDRAVVRRAGTDVTLVAYGGTLRVAQAAADALVTDGIEAEVIDLRTLRPLDEKTLLDSVTRTHRLVVVDEGWRSVGIAAEIAARAAEYGY